jgi:hypothetical protein
MPDFLKSFRKCIICNRRIRIDNEILRHSEQPPYFSYHDSCLSNTQTTLQDSELRARVLRERVGIEISQIRRGLGEADYGEMEELATSLMQNNRQDNNTWYSSTTRIVPINSTGIGTSYVPLYNLEIEKKRSNKEKPKVDKQNKMKKIFGKEGEE